jgi:hypothetical protein
MTTFPLRLTEELRALAKAQVSLNQYITTVLAAHVGAPAEAEHSLPYGLCGPGRERRG